ncbi:anthranilate synthase component I family protein [Cytobacillus purgationiresistens]|uniref:Para-aminobenzoate synthetase component 1 n=1 Tax=Cytobacillus purgationiresistens TaxID=863449 RepID=A0ABU0AP57_9BACI|nr:anthranilate synthase component I family protein [Cytobacillus purgationiresistens]MDQ0273076.1 para-aminobenzoate synthetase component 1 [Cytobacillus purgationiresistens]
MNQLKIHTKKITYSNKRFFPQYSHIASQYDHHVILESGRSGRYSIAAFNPATILKGKDSTLQIVSGNKKQSLSGNPLHLMKEWFSQYKVDKYEGLPDFKGGAIGFLSYDYGRYIEQIPNLASDDLDMPDLHFFVFKEWFVYDHEEKVLWLLFLYEHSEEQQVAEREAYWLKQWTMEWPAEECEERIQPSNEMDVSMDEQGFIQAVEKIQQYIAKGDVFQVNLSVRGSKPMDVEAMEVYKQLRELNPSPYMGYVHTPDYQLVSGSPELLVKKKDEVVSTRPIAGTRSRGKDEIEDMKLANELIENEKERAEHVMLVDLERNDLGRVCRYGTVVVDEFMAIEKYSHVMHIVSNVKGEIADGKDGFDLTDAVFPGGTITGAPKVRTMEIIEELEPVRRGIYTGSLGWMDFSGDLELNIMIRTMLVKDKTAYVQAGAGVVIDSNPKAEYKESFKKAIALWRAKEMAEGAKGENL